MLTIPQPPRTPTLIDGEILGNLAIATSNPWFDRLTRTTSAECEEEGRATGITSRTPGWEAGLWTPDDDGASLCSPSLRQLLRELVCARLPRVGTEVGNVSGRSRWLLGMVVGAARFSALVARTDAGVIVGWTILLVAPSAEIQRPTLPEALEATGALLDVGLRQGSDSEGHHATAAGGAQ